MNSLSSISIRTFVAATVAVSFVQAEPLLAQTSPAAVGTMIVAHGGGPSWDSRVDSIAAAVKTGGPVAVSFLMGPGAATRRFQDVAAKLVERGAKEIVIVPLFVSSHSGHIDQIRYLAGELDSLDHTMMHHLHMSGIERATVKIPMRVAAALDDSPQLARVLADRALAMTSTPKTQALYLIGHGSNSAEDHAQWMLALRKVADSVQRWTSFRDVKVGLVRDDAPAPVRAEAVKSIRETILLQYGMTGKKVIVVPILVSSGSVSNAKIPADLADLPVEYRSVPLLPHMAIARWVESRTAEPGSLARPAAAAPAAAHSH